MKITASNIAMEAYNDYFFQLRRRMESPYVGESLIGNKIKDSKSPSGGIFAKVVRMRWGQIFFGKGYKKDVSFPLVTLIE